MAQQDAITLLDDDHKKVEMLFSQLQSGGDQQQIAQQICQELTVHMQIEDEIFYPAFLRATSDKKLIDESKHEHEEVRQMIRQVEGGKMDDALMKKMQAAVDDHVKDERTKMFPEARRTQGLDLMQLGQQLQQRKSELMAAHPA